MKHMFSGTFACTAPTPLPANPPGFHGRPRPAVASFGWLQPAVAGCSQLWLAAAGWGRLGGLGVRPSVATAGCGRPEPRLSTARRVGSSGYGSYHTFTHMPMGRE